MGNRTNNLRILFVLMCLYPIMVAAQWNQTFSYKNNWSSWDTGRGRIQIYSDQSGIILKTDGGQKYFSFQITNYVPPTKNELKEHLRSNLWFEYYGTVEYMVNDNYPTAEALAKSCCFVIPNPRIDNSPSVMRRTTCRITVAPYEYKKLPSTYNVFFDNIGVGISIKGMDFEGEKRHTRSGRVVANIFQSILLFPIGIGSWWWNPVKAKNR